MDRVVVSKAMIGICYMQVCAVSDATDEEILEVANIKNPAGTSGGWVEVAREDNERKDIRPVDCAELEGRKHFIVIC